MISTLMMMSKESSYSDAMSAGDVCEAMESEVLMPKEMNLLCEDVMSRKRTSSEIFNYIKQDTVKAILER